MDRVVDVDELSKRLRAALANDWAGKILDCLTGIANIKRQVSYQEIVASIQASSRAASIATILEEDGEFLLTLVRDVREVRVTPDV